MSTSLSSSPKPSPPSSKSSSPSPVSSTSSVKRFSTASQKSSQPATADPSTHPTEAAPVILGGGMYTEHGLDSDFKKRVFEHWEKLLSSEGSNISPPENFFAVTRYAEIWSEVALRPVSLDPFNEQEREAIATGIFYHIARRVGQQFQHRHGQQHQKSQTSANYRTGGGRQRGPPSSSSSSYPTRRSTTAEGKDNEEEQVLWASEEVAPTAGSIDEKGVFHSKPPVASQAIPPGLNSFAASSDVNNGEAPVWFYKDPKGNEQGPFSSETMLDWYNRKFFTDALPLRKQQDPIFEPLGYWRAKNNSKVPFDVPPPSLSPTPPSINNLVSSGSLPSSSTLTEEAPAAAMKKETPASLAPIGSKRSLSSQEKIKKVDINSLFSSGQKGISVVSSVSSDSLEKKQSVEPVKEVLSTNRKTSEAEIHGKADSTRTKSTAITEPSPSTEAANRTWNILNSTVNTPPSLSSIIKEQKTPSPIGASSPVSSIPASQQQQQQHNPHFPHKISQHLGRLLL